jgi:thiamine-monophosphate kinase
MTSEGALLNRIRKAVLSDGGRRAGCVRLGIGDDAAILKPGRGRELILSSDFLIEGVHFLPADPPNAIGYKALARAVSDLAAMGAAPIGFLLNLAMPPARTGAWLNKFLGGLDHAARKFRISLIGGDLAKNSKADICVVVLGDAPSGRAIRRSGARPGDLIYVSGKLGAARLGLAISLKRFDKRRDARSLLTPHLYPSPRLELGSWLASRRAATAMMDISDGLSIDLARLCEASRTGAVIYADCIPAVRIREAWRRRLHLSPASALDFALNGGDDYELVFTVPERRVKELKRAPSGVRLTCIGEVTRKREVLLVNSTGQESPLQIHGWDHFRRE